MSRRAKLSAHTRAASNAGSTTKAFKMYIVLTRTPKPLSGGALQWLGMRAGQAMTPVARVAPQVHDSNDEDGSLLEGIENGVRKSAGATSAHVLFQNSKPLRRFQDSINSSLDFNRE